MIKSKVRRTLCALTLGFCLAGSVMPVYAQTISFDITVPGDIISKRASKADTEQSFHVTGTSFNKSGQLNCVSIKRSNSSVKSYTAGISSTKLSSYANYKSYAAPNTEYYMSCTATVSGIHVKGRYTP